MSTEAAAELAPLALTLLHNRDEIIDSRKMTVAQAVDRYIALRVAEGGIVLKTDTARHVAKHVGERLCSAMGSMRLADVQPDHLRSWLADLVNPKGKGRPMHPTTRAHHLKDVKAFFKRAVLEDWLDKSPARAVKLPPIPQADVTLIAVKDAFSFFKANRGDRAVGRLSLEAFGGLRYTSAARIVKSEILFDTHGIIMPGVKHKSKKRQFRQGHPANLWQWLEHAPAICWELSKRQYLEHKKFMMIIGGLRPACLINDQDRQAAHALHNIWRHSFASYLLAITKVYPPVSYLMQHSNAKMTEHYEGRATEADARAYFAITPETVKLSWEEFSARYGGHAHTTAAPIVGCPAPAA